MKKVSFKERLKEKFDFDVTALDDYVDEQSENFFTDLIQSSAFLSELVLMEGVKGSEKIKLLTGDVSLQAQAGCTPTPDGSMVFTDDEISATRLYVGIEFCNEDLNGKYTQILNVLGVRNQDETLPLETLIIGYLGMLLKRKAQRIVILGDTASGDPDLAHFDGLVKLLDNSLDVLQAFSTETAIDASNGYDIAKTVYDTIPAEVFDSQLNYVILTGRQEARAIIDQVWNDKDFQANIDDVVDEGGTLSFTLPTTEIKVQTIPELNGLGKMYGFAFPYAFLATDLESDMDGLELKYDDYDNQLKAETSFRLGTQFIFGQYFVRLRLTPTS